MFDSCRPLIEGKDLYLEELLSVCPDYPEYAPNRTDTVCYFNDEPREGFGPGAGVATTVESTLVSELPTTEASRGSRGPSSGGDRTSEGSGRNSSRDEEEEEEEEECQCKCRAPLLELTNENHDLYGKVSSMTLVFNFL